MFVSSRVELGSLAPKLGIIPLNHCINFVFMELSNVKKREMSKGII